MIELIKKIYDEAYKESHLSGLQAVWDAAVAHVRSEMAKIETAVEDVVEAVTETAPDPEPQPMVEPAPDLTPDPVDPQPEATATDAPQA